MRWYHSTKTAKVLWETLDGATHGASISCPMHNYEKPTASESIRCLEPIHATRGALLRHSQGVATE